MEHERTTIDQENLALLRATLIGTNNRGMKQ